MSIMESPRIVITSPQGHDSNELKEEVKEKKEEPFKEDGNSAMTVETRKRTASLTDSKKRNSTDLRERSLAMYKSINNMLTLVSKKDSMPITKVTVGEAEGVALDFIYREQQNGVPLSVEEVKAIRGIVDEVLRPGSIEEAFYVPSPAASIDDNSDVELKDEENIHDSSSDDSYPSTIITPIQMIDTTKLKNLLKKTLPLLKQLKKDTDNSNKSALEGNVKLGVEFSVAATQGQRKTMEDQFTIIAFLNELMGLSDSPPLSFVGIYDGHSGKAAAEYTKTHLHVNIVRDSHFKTDLQTASVNAYKQTDRDFNYIAMREGMTSGTTAVTALITEKFINIANVGDSEAVLCQNGKAVVLSESHLPNKTSEKERIQKSGGTVVWYGTWRVNGLLSVSRSIGDNALKDVVIAEPHFVQYSRTSEDEFLILATDGLWDVLSHQEACNFVREFLKTQNKKDICQLLIDEALLKKTADNVAALVVFFR